MIAASSSRRPAASQRRAFRGWGVTLALAIIFPYRISAQQPAAAKSRAPAFLTGQVWDDQRDQPIAGVIITVAGSPAELATDPRGYFAITFSGGALVLNLKRLGYQPATRLIEAPSGDTTRLSFFLAEDPALLDTVSVKAAPPLGSARLEGFTERRRQNTGGTFISRPEIEKRNAIETTSLLRGLNGVRIIDSLGVLLVASARGPSPSILSRRSDPNAPCLMMIGVDGQLQDWAFPVDQIVPRDIEAIEVYSGPSTIPREFAARRNDVGCGLVMIWTR